MYSLPVEDLNNIADRLREIWPEKKAFLITGGTGFFGRWLVESICFLEKSLNSGNRYIIFSRQKRDELISKIPVLAGSYFVIREQDIQEPFEVKENIDFVLHAASDIAKIKNSKVSNFGSITVATDNLIKAVDPDKLSKFLYVSSGGVYEASEKAAKEDELKLAKTEEIQTYAEAKRQSELLVMKISRSCIARCFSFVGPFVDPKMAVMDMISKKIQKESIIVNSPKVVRSFMYPSDLVVGLFKLLLLDNKQKIYNLGSDRPVSLLDLAKEISRFETNSEVLYKDGAESISLAGSCYFANIDRIQSEFGDILTVDLPLALEKTYKFMNKKGIV